MITLSTAANPGSRIVTAHLHLPLQFTSVSLWYVRSCAMFPRLSDVCLHPRNRRWIFRGGVRLRESATYFSRPTPATLAFADWLWEAYPSCQSGRVYAGLRIRTFED